MNPTFKKFIRHYLAGMLASMWNGGIGAVAGIMGINGASLSGVAPDARILNASEMLSAFVGAVVIHGVFWLKSHPVPENFGTRSPFWTSVRESTPSAPPQTSP
jgi:hypothetical protein